MVTDTTWCFYKGVRHCGYLWSAWFFVYVVKYTQHKIFRFNHFETYSSVAVSAFTLLGNHHHYLFPDFDFYFIENLDLCVTLLQRQKKIIIWSTLRTSSQFHLFCYRNWPKRLEIKGYITWEILTEETGGTWWKEQKLVRSTCVSGSLCGWDFSEEVP